LKSNSKNYNYHFVQGVLIALVGAVLFSTKAIFVKLAYRDTPVDALSLLALRMVFSVPFFLGAAVLSSNRTTNVRFTSREWVYVAFIGCLGYYVSSFLDFAGLQYVSAGIERLILFIYPTLTLLMSAIIFKVRIRSLQGMALAITYIGLAAAFFGEIDFDSQNGNFFFGAALILVCAFTYAGYIVGSGRLIPKVGASKFNSYAMSFACAAVLLHFLLFSDVSLLHLASTVYIYSALMAIFATVVPSYMVTAAINRIGSDNAAIVGSIGPVSTILMAYFFLGESITVWQLIGTACILVGVLIIGRQKERN
jgi:drug/metabolite transporter (DMT)-like permease